MYYLSNIEGNISFKVDTVHEILETDVPISDEAYKNYFKMQGLGNEYTVKNNNGLTFDDIFELLPKEPYVHPKSPEQIQIDKLTADLATAQGAIDYIVNYY